MSDFKMPEWMDCTWRRIPCGRDDCPICGKIKQDEEKHIQKGEDPDSPEAMLEDVSHNFREALEAIKADAEDQGIDIENIDDIKEPPKPQEFDLYEKTKRWWDSVMVLVKESESEKGSWLETEAGKDLVWYANTVLAKTYRQLCNRWHLENGDEYGDVDYDYTQYVLKEVFKFLDDALRDLQEKNTKHNKEFKLAQIFLNQLKNEILNI